MTAPVVRKWNATVARADLDDWVATYRGKMLDHVRKVDGFREVVFLAERDTDPCRVTALTTWDDMDAVIRFAGDTPAKAVIPDFMKPFFVAADPEASFHDVLLQEKMQ
ncbi:hypothetical protein SAMN04488515_0668 [Cognatiyoonia koreensis]|uniref:Antibiotic biosynthesis monooxygenase n=1 Tax=Cognatiyoonia koreensis TaxID=364200 RepID=A0A1I0NJU7_9RHOB|nr:hypothetical protein [Cognatiyoonia koreensis]SEW01756.1 hypothetical protein SAMN04488515_0668 [Cognatiyoonia koreensis]